MDNSRHLKAWKLIRPTDGPLKLSLSKGVFTGGSDKKVEHPSVKLSNQSVLDCPICLLRPLTIPVFQCTNGHVACSSCHGKLKDKCPSCSTNLGNMRNRAIESVLESIEISCSYKIYGCSEKTIYSDKRSHEETCVFAPYTCPFMDCNFLGCGKYLHSHLKVQHTSSVFLMTSLGDKCLFTLVEEEKFVVFLDENHGGIFILNLKDKRMRISTIQVPNYAKGRKFGYILTADHKCGSFKFKSVTYPWPDANVVEEELAASTSLLKYFLRALCYFFSVDRGIIFRLLISGDDEC